MTVSDPRSRLVGVTPAYLAGGPADFQAVLHDLRKNHGWAVTTHGHGVRATSPCHRATVHEARWSTSRPGLTLSAQTPAGDLLWHATITPHTPVEFVLPAVTALAVALREDPAGADRHPVGTGTVDVGQWTPPPGWSVTYSSDGYEIHDPSDGLASFVVRTPGPGENSDPRWQTPGYTLLGGPEDSPHQWSAEFSPGFPPAAVAAMYHAVADPQPVVRRATDVPAHHWPHATTTPLAPPAPARRLAAASRITAAPTKRSTASPPAAPAPPGVRRPAR